MKCSSYPIYITSLFLLAVAMPTVVCSQPNEPGDTENIMLPGDVPLEMVWIPPGSFEMGSPKDEQDRDSDEGPQHEVTIAKGFYMGAYSITREQWHAVMGSNPDCYGPCTPDVPVHNISWYTAQDFIEGLNELGIGTYRLPSEAEWEYAARAGTQTRFYHGDDPEALSDYAWYSENNDPSGPKPVGRKNPNNFGLYDMLGNVWEWCEDDWHSNYEGAPEDGSAWVDDPEGSYRVLRGGYYLNGAAHCRSAIRNYSSPDYTLNGRGLRVVRTP